MAHSPILSALPIFDSVARHGSFSRAATELGLTQSAISHRIKSLETSLGVVLFSRRGRNLKITTDGLKLAETAQVALRIVDETCQSFGNPLAGKIRVGVLPSFGSVLLAPKISAFTKDHPGISVSVSTIDVDFSQAHKDPVTWDPSNLDVVITWGRGGWKSLEHRVLVHEEMIPVCTPEYLSQHLLNNPQDMWAHSRLIHGTRSDAWAGYATSLNLPTNRKLDAGHSGLEFEHFFMILEAVRAHAGFALIPSILAQADIASGRLVQCAKSWKTGNFYAVVASIAALEHPVVATIVKWLTLEFAAIES